MAAFVTRCRARGLSGKTVSNYKWALDYLGEVLPSTALEVEVLLAEASGHLAGESRYALWLRLRTFFRFLARRYEQVNPFERVNAGGELEVVVEAPVRSVRLPRVLSQAQVGALLLKGCAGPRDRLMVLVILDTGLRLGEVARLRKEDVAADGLRVKGKRGERLVPVSKVVLHDLLVLGSAGSPWSLRSGQDLSGSGVHIALRRIFSRAGVKGGPHSLRHTFATEYLRRGGSVRSLQRILGHRDLATTALYLDLVDEGMVEDHRQFSPVQQYVGFGGRLL